MSQNSNSPVHREGEPLSFEYAPRVALIYTEWNEQIARELKNGCESMIHRYGGDITHCKIVPGCFELPFACKALWDSSTTEPTTKPEAIIALGAVIRGGTPHFEYVSKAVTEGILQLNLLLPIPVIFGVLTLDNEAQAWERLGGAYGHKGEEAGLAALRMIHFTRTLALQH